MSERYQENKLRGRKVHFNIRATRFGARYTEHCRVWCLLYNLDPSFPKKKSGSWFCPTLHWNNMELHTVEHHHIELRYLEYYGYFDILIMRDYQSDLVVLTTYLWSILPSISWMSRSLLPQSHRVQYNRVWLYLVVVNWKVKVMWLTGQQGWGRLRSLITITILITGHRKLLITITIMIIWQFFFW
jgi:hypothetical protein